MHQQSAANRDDVSVAPGDRSGNDVQPKLRVRKEPATSRPVFVLGLGGTGLAAVQSLGRRGIPVVGFSYRKDDPGRASRYCRRVIPGPDPVAEPAAALMQLRAERESWPEDPVLIPAEDCYIALISRYAMELQDTFRINLPSNGILQRLEDKRFQYRAAFDAGVPIPQTFSPANMNEAREIANKLRYPAIIKGAYAHLFCRAFSTKAFKVAGPEEFCAAYARVFAAGVDAVAQEMVPGPVSSLVSACIYCSDVDGKPTGEFAMRKLRQSPPECGVGTMVESVHDPEVLQLARQLCEAIGYRGMAEIEFKRDPEDGVPRLIELNARLWEQTSIATAAGVDFPYLLYRDLDDGYVSQVSGYRVGIRWVSLYEDIYIFHTSRVKLGLTFWGWLRSWQRVRRIEYMAFDDPGPFLFWLRGLFGLVRTRTQRALRAAGQG